MIAWGLIDCFALGAPYWTCVNSWNKAWGEEGNIHNNCLAAIYERRTLFPYPIFPILP